MNSTSSLNVGKLLADLKSPDAYERKVAAEDLRSINESSDEIVIALVRVAFWDSNKIVASTARQTLDAPVHRAVLQQHPEWVLEETQHPIDLNPKDVGFSWNVKIVLLSLVQALAVLIPFFAFKRNVDVLLLMPFPMIAAFIIGLRFRITKSFWIALLFSLPTSFAYAFAYFSPTVDIEGYMIQLFLSCVLVPLCAVLTAVMLIVGSRTRDNGSSTGKAKD